LMATPNNIRSEEITLIINKKPAGYKGYLIQKLKGINMTKKARGN
ncbi:MAG: hypothetical protein RL365_1695, partial [Bacteroidota bacterium]